jgi:hypothetical protein
MRGEGALLFYDYGEDSLLAFTASLLAILNERSIQVEDPLFLLSYARQLQAEHSPTVRTFRVDFPLPQRRPFWETREEKAEREYWEPEARKATAQPTKRTKRKNRKT